MSGAKRALDQGDGVLWAETPANIREVPAVVTLDMSRPEQLEAAAWQYWNEHTGFRKRAEELGHDVVALAKKNILVTGIGIAAVLGITAGAIILLQHERKEEDNKD